jgi:hypothetical protein
MMEHYSHVRIAAKCTALQKLEGGFMNSPPADGDQPCKNSPVSLEGGMHDVTNRVTNAASRGAAFPINY